MKQSRMSTSIAIAGWLCGLAAAAAGDYYLIHQLTELTGQMSIALGVGLAFGLMVMFIFTELSQRLAGGTGVTAAGQSPKRKSLPRPGSRATRIFAIVSLLSVLITIVSEVFLPGALR